MAPCRCDTPDTISSSTSSLAHDTKSSTPYFVPAKPLKKNAVFGHLVSLGLYLSSASCVHHSEASGATKLVLLSCIALVCFGVSLLVEMAEVHEVGPDFSTVGWFRSDFTVKKENEAPLILREQAGLTAEVPSFHPPKSKRKVRLGI